MSKQDTDGIEREMDATLRAIRALGPCLEGSLKDNAKGKYTKKDGTVSLYATAPILQYRAGPKKRCYRRVPAGKKEAVREMLANGKKYRALASRYEALSAQLALSFKKKA